jgi:hypothetical protein
MVDLSICFKNRVECGDYRHVLALLFGVVSIRQIIAQNFHAQAIFYLTRRKRGKNQRKPLLG